MYLVTEAVQLIMNVVIIQDHGANTNWSLSEVQKYFNLQENYVGKRDAQTVPVSLYYKWLKRNRILKCEKRGMFKFGSLLFFMTESFYVCSTQTQTEVIITSVLRNTKRDNFLSKLFQKIVMLLFCLINLSWYIKRLTLCI